MNNECLTPVWELILSSPIQQTYARGVKITGATGKELNDALAVHGLFFPGGHCPDVGLGGFLLQGGMGWNCAVSNQAGCSDTSRER